MADVVVAGTAVAGTAVTGAALAAGAAALVLVTGAAGALAGAAVAAGAGADAASLTSSKSTKEPSATLSPSLTFNSFTTPLALLGISMLALSDSTVISDCSACTVSPGLTSNSMTSTSLKSPMSGTLTSTWLIVFAPCFW